MKEEISAVYGELLETLQARFEGHMHRHAKLAWTDILAKLETNEQKLRSLLEMEKTGGEPDVIGCNEQTAGYLFADCARESPAGRRNLCYDRKALESRKEHRPVSSAMDVAASMGITLLTEEQYRALQRLEAFDTKTSSWIITPRDIRELGGALFCDRRYGHVFVYHNGAESYYAARGFRGALEV